MQERPAQLKRAGRGTKYARLQDRYDSMAQTKMRFLHVFSSIPVVERDTAMEWYERFTGRPADLIPNNTEAAWQLTDLSWLYILAEPDRAGSALHTLLVDDLHAFVVGLADREIAPGPIETMDNGARFVIVTDPDGNRLKVARCLSRSRWSGSDVCTAFSRNPARAPAWAAEKPS